jgi:hypothetical protein
MHMTKRIFVILSVVFPMICLSNEVPDRFPVLGAIWDIDSIANAIVVNDKLYYLTPATRIERADGDTGSRPDLLKGQRVGLFFTVDDKRQYIVTTLWTLSEGAASEHRHPVTQRKLKTA